MVDVLKSEEQANLKQGEQMMPPKTAPKAPPKPSAPKFSDIPVVDTTNNQTIETKTKITKPKTSGKKRNDSTENSTKTTVKNGVVSQTKKRVVKTTHKDGTVVKKVVSETVVLKPNEPVLPLPIKREKPVRPAMPSPFIPADGLTKEQIEPRFLDEIKPSQMLDANAPSKIKISDSAEKAEETSVNNQFEQEVKLGSETLVKQEEDGEEAKPKQDAIEEKKEMSAKQELESDLMALYEANEAAQKMDLPEEEENLSGLDLSKSDKILIVVVLLLIILGTVIVLLVPGIMPMM